MFSNSLKLKIELIRINVCKLNYIFKLQKYIIIVKNTIFDMIAVTKNAQKSVN